MNLYRGMSESEYKSRLGLTRRSDRVAEQLYAGETKVGAGDTHITIGGPSLGNALSMHTIDSPYFALALLSFSSSFDVAAYYALQRRWDTEQFGIVVETNAQLLKAAGIPAVSNMDRHPWEQEISLVMQEHATLPDNSIAREHWIDLQQLRKSASALSHKWSHTTGVPQFLENVGY